MAAMLWWPLILALPLPFTRAGPLSSRSLTDHITSVAPRCSHSCISTFIHDNFPVQVCTPENFNCLCINPTTTGYTLGEAALTCLYATCDGQESKAVALYTVCGSIPGAQPNTHSSLPESFLGSAVSSIASSTTSVGTSSTSSSTQSSSSSQSSQTSSTTATSSGSSSSTTSTATTTSPPSSTATDTSTSTTSETTSTSTSLPATQTTSSSTTAATSATSSATAAPVASQLSKSQIAGVVIASIGAAALAFGFCFFLVCYRRRRKHNKRRGSDASWGEKMPQSQDSSPEFDQPRGFAQAVASPPPNGPSLQVTTPSAPGWQNWGRNSNPHGIGLALAPDTREEGQRQRREMSPMTPYSQRRQSQLLPDRPHYTKISTKARDSLNRHSKSLHVPIPAYRPDRTPPMNGPVFPSTIDTSQANLQSVQRSMSDPFYNEPRSPPVDYRGVPYTPYTNPSVRPTSIARVADTSSVIPRNTVPPTISESGDIPPLPVAGLARLKSQKQPPRRKSASSSRYTRFSTDSATSFEDIDEEQTPLRSTPMPGESYFHSSTSEDEVPPLPVKSTKRDSHIINRPHPTRSQRRGKKDVPKLALDTQSRDVRQTAKWKILVSPGLQSLEESLPVTPKTPKTPANLVKTPPPPATDVLPRPIHRISDFR